MKKQVNITYNGFLVIVALILVTPIVIQPSFETLERENTKLSITKSQCERDRSFHDWSVRLKRNNIDIMASSREFRAPEASTNSTSATPAQP